MNFRKIVFLMVVFLVQVLHAQSEPMLPELSVKGRTIQEVIPTGWKILSKASGDLNEDGQINVMDIVQLANCILVGNCDILSNGCAGDINDDGNWNILDIVQLANCVLGNDCAGIANGCAGDMNNDGVFNILDIVILANCVLAGNCGE